MERAALMRMLSVIYTLCFALPPELSPPVLPGTPTTDDVVYGIALPLFGQVADFSFPLPQIPSPMPPPEWISQISATRIVKNKESGKFNCPIAGCNKRYIRKGELKFHVKGKHCEEFPKFEKMFKSRSSREGKPFQCPVRECPCGFMLKGDRTRHIRNKHSQLVKARRRIF